MRHGNPLFFCCRFFAVAVPVWCDGGGCLCWCSCSSTSCEWTTYCVVGAGPLIVQTLVCALSLHRRANALRLVARPRPCDRSGASCTWRRRFNGYAGTTPPSPWCSRSFMCPADSRFSTPSVTRSTTDVLFFLSWEKRGVLWLLGASRCRKYFGCTVI